MEDKSKRIGLLIVKQINEHLTESEIHELNQWLGLSEINRAWYNKILSDKSYLTNKMAEYAAAEETQEREWEKISSVSLGARRFSVVQLWGRVAVAASVILVLGTGIFLLARRSQPKPTVVQQAIASKSNDLAPGGNKAILTLGNGRQIILEKVANGIIAQQGNTDIKKLNNGQLSYKTLNEKPESVEYNTLTTPRGGTYKLTLPDGSQVWLNAGSSITYPTTFTGGARDVSITGEAYFEITKNKTSPFHVKVNDMTIAVLGTSFNVNAYADEQAIATTLLEGSVKILNGMKSSSILKPGQQALVSGDEIKTEDKVDVEESVAWKNGVFQFDNASIETVMRRLARWYDVDKVVYEGKKTTNGFSGKINRNYNASDALKILELSNVHFRIEGKSIIVMP